jgi:DNA-directed RNA polymerase specialized sigma24 family protein
MLRFIAFHVLGRPARAEEAIENCWYTASRGVPLFEYEGEFRGWLLRAFIEEALALLLESRQRSNLKPLRYLRRTGVAVGFQSRSD